MASWWARSTSATTKRIRKLLPQICAIQKDSWNSRLGRRHIPFGQRRHTSVFFLSLPADCNGISLRFIHYAFISDEISLHAR